MKKVLSYVFVVATIVAFNLPNQSANAGNKSWRYSHEGQTSSGVQSTVYKCDAPGSQCTNGSTAVVANSNLSEYAQGLIPQEQ